MVRNDEVFADRRDAGIRLGRLLENEYKNKNVLVLGIPRGGVEVAYYVAELLNADLSAIVSKKLPLPEQEEVAFGAVTEDGSVYLSPLADELNKETISRIVKEQIFEIKRRIKEYRAGKPLPDITNRIVIIVDDGIATGSTIVPALKLCRGKKAAKIIVAAPVSGKRYVPEIDELADEVRVLEVPSGFFAVGQVYRDFHGLTDNEVIDLLDSF